VPTVQIAVKLADKGSWQGPPERLSHPNLSITRILFGTWIARIHYELWGFEVMLIAGLVVFLLILGMFLQALTSSPRDEPEWPSDTDEELPTTVAHADEDTHAVAA
jgi:hypothetical protein